MANAFATVDEYIDSFPGPVAERLQTIRRITRDVVPAAGERISYGIAAATLGGRDIIFYSGWKRHVALYPVPHGNEALDSDLAVHRAGRGTLQFPHDRPLPEDLLRRVVAALTDDRAGRSEPVPGPGQRGRDLG
jgi:uncharacterized protein YdhG (YjbR/CyaY superfamily)